MSDRARVLVVQSEAEGGLGRFRPALEDVAGLDVRRPFGGDPLPPDLTGYAGLVVLGGAMGAADDDVAPWLPATRRLLAAGVEAQLPTLGICLGAQLLALATGGRVHRGASGLEVGVVPVRVLPAGHDDPVVGPIMERLGPCPLVPQFHEDAVTQLPPGAVLLAAGERYPHQAYRLGGRAWGLQYHPEVTAADFAGWLRDGHGSLAAAGVVAAEVAESYSAAEGALAELARCHAEAFASLL